jgi:hypothetical protein
MTEDEVGGRLKELQQNVELVVQGLESLGRSIRAHARMDDLDIEMDAIRSYLNDLHPDLEECFAVIRRQASPETGSDGL